MTIKTPETIRQLAYAKRVAEELSDIIAKEDDDKFNVVAFELADGLVRRIEHAISMLNRENVAVSEEIAKAKFGFGDFGYALAP